VITTSPVWTQAEVDALRAAVASGILEVMYDGPPKRLVRYHSLDAMRALLAEMVRAVNIATVPTHRFATHSKGFCR
jgi:hypothetical protein